MSDRNNSCTVDDGSHAKSSPSVGCRTCNFPAWLRAQLLSQPRILWTSEDLVAQYGGAINTVGKGLAVRKIRLRVRGVLTKKRAIYCVKEKYIPAFMKSKPSQLRATLMKQQHADAMAIVHSLKERYKL